MSLILGIETSCDETAAAVIDDQGKILSNIVYSQIEEHKKFKGVVPEVASKSHLKNLSWVIKKALQDSNCSIMDIQGFAATSGPGLIGSLMIGTMYAKTFSSIFNKPYIAVNHLEGHALSPKITEDIDYPYLLLLISGGHCQYIAVLEYGKYHVLGESLDDAVGEAFDKTAKLLNLEYPGGPALELSAKLGQAKYHLPLSMVNKPGCDMSFSGLKTAVFKLIHEVSLSSNITNTECKVSPLNKKQYIYKTNYIKQIDSSQIPYTKVCDIAASFQSTVTQILVHRTKNAIGEFENLLSKKDKHTNKKYFVIAGGVASNNYLREALKCLANDYQYCFKAPKHEYCTDNAAMIAYVALQKYKQHSFSDIKTAPLSKWKISEV